MGTSLTEEGVRELRRLADAVLLCFDADAAGQEAALRGMEIAERSGLRVRIVALPGRRGPGRHPGARPRGVRGGAGGRTAGAGVPDRPRARARERRGGPRRRLRGVPRDPRRRRARARARRAGAPRVERAAARCRLRRGARARPPARAADARRVAVAGAARPAPEAHHRLLAASLVARIAPTRRRVAARDLGAGPRRGQDAAFRQASRATRRACSPTPPSYADERRRTRRGAGRRREPPPVGRIWEWMTPSLS